MNQAFRLGALLLAVAFAADGRSSRAKEAVRSPNILFIIADDLGYADLSIQGAKDIKTPRIDSIAREGARCTNGYVSCPYCSPTRAAILTGRYQQRFGHEFNPATLRQKGIGQGLPTSETTIADRLGKAGYATGIIGKWHQGEEDRFHPSARGFHEFYGFLEGSHDYFKTETEQFGPIYRGKRREPLQGYLTDALAEEAVGFIKRRRTEPFFLYLAFNAVHTPMHAPAQAEKNFAHVADPTRRTYLAMLAKLDEAVGRVLDAIRESGIEDDTLVFFISDNGGPMGKFASNGSSNGSLRGSKGDTFEGGIRVPFFVKWKNRIPAGSIYEKPILSLDMTATAIKAAAANGSGATELDGVDLIPFLEGKLGDSPHKALYWRFGSQMAIRKGEWKLVRSSLGKREYQDVSEKPMLFNLSSDMNERIDLANARPELVEELQADWARWNAELKPPAWPATLRGAPFRAAGP